MKRLFLVVLLLLCGLVFALPGGVGMLAEQGHERAVAHAVGIGHPLQASFSRGWFGSRAQHVYRIEDPRLRQVAGAVTGEQVGVPSLVIDSQVHHGPLPLGTLRPAWSEARSTLLLRTASGVDFELPGHITSRLGADAKSRFRYQAPAGGQTLSQGLEARWQDIDIGVRLSRVADTMAIDGAADGLELIDGDARLSLAGLTLEGVQSRVGTGLWTGTTAWRVDSISAPATRAERVSLDTQVSSIDGQPVYRVSGTIGSLQSDIVTGNELRFDVELRNVDSMSAAALLELAAAGRVLEVFSPQQRTLMRRLLAGGPQLTLHDLRVPSGDADLEGTARISVAAATDPASVGWLASAIDAETNLAVPRNLVHAFAAAGSEQTRAAIDLMIRLQILKREGNRYRVTARYANGLLNVNGFPVPVPQF